MKKQPKMEVIITAKAKEELIEHVRFLAQVSPGASQKLYQNFMEAIESLKEMPERCRYFNLNGLQFYTYRRLVLQKRYLIIFKITDDKVAILNIIDGRQK